MAVLGVVYEHLIKTGAYALANDLYAAKAAIDYAFLPAKEASSSDEGEHVYVAKFSGKRYDTTYPPPRPCFTCGKRHWGSNCPQKAEQQKHAASQSFSRGKPPARYYVSKTGQCFDTTRRPNKPCNQCPGKYHWWFACPRRLVPHPARCSLLRHARWTRAKRANCAIQAAPDRRHWQLRQWLRSLAVGTGTAAASKTPSPRACPHPTHRVVCTSFPHSCTHDVSRLQ